MAELRRRQYKYSLGQEVNDGDSRQKRGQGRRRGGIKEQEVLKGRGPARRSGKKLNNFGDNAAKTKARLEAWSRKKKIETEM